MKPELTPVAEPPVDEQGEPWPPPEALVAVVRGYGAPFDGQVVEVGPWLPRFGYFECYTLATSIGGMFGIGDPLLCAPEEMISCNEATSSYLADAQAAAVEMYDDDVYDLRDMLEKIGIMVTAESVSTWDSRGRARIKGWAQALAEWQAVSGNKDSKHPTLPTPPEVA